MSFYFFPFFSSKIKKTPIFTVTNNPQIDNSWQNPLNTKSF